MRRLLTPLLLVLAACAALPAAAGASYTIAMGDEQPTMFSNPLFQALDITQARLIVSYNVVSAKGAELARTDAWLAAAHDAGIQPLVSFNHRRHDNCQAAKGPRRKCHAPSVREFTAAFAAFRKRYPWVRVYSPWNEANHRSQPTFHRPDLAATYYEVVRKACRGRCTIVGLDMLDTDNIRSPLNYVRAFRADVKVQPRIWGLHNYTGTNDESGAGTKAFARAVPGEVWLTETGGIVAFGSKRQYSAHRAATSLRFLFTLADQVPKVKRLYLYAWSGSPAGAYWDSGLTNQNGTARPGYTVVEQAILLRRR